MLTTVLRGDFGSVRRASPASARLAPSSSAGRSPRPPRRSRAKQGVFKNGSRRGEEAEFGSKNTSASLPRRLRLLRRFLNAQCRAKLNRGFIVDTRTVSLRQ